jgi:aminomethyltransferase
LRIVVNAACKDKDFDFIRSQLIGDLKLLPRMDLSLISLQGPKAHLVLCKLFPQIINMPFMTSKDFFWNNKNISISRCGYTGEDGFEISLENEITLSLAEELLSFEEVLPIGLAARDTLRLEAGLCLYGNDIDETITPVQADLGWSIGKRRIKEKSFLGSKKLISEINNHSIKKRVGLKILDKSIARKGMIIKSVDGLEVGKITSGAFGPSVGYPIALGYVLSEFSNSETNLLVSIRNKNVAVKVVQLPFIKHRYYKGVTK